MVKIRLQRGGRTHRPVYTIVATNSRTPRNGRFLEKLGQYDPSSTEVLKDVKVEAVNYGPCPDWHLGKGGETWLFLDEFTVK